MMQAKDRYFSKNDQCSNTGQKKTTSQCKERENVYCVLLKCMCYIAVFSL